MARSRTLARYWKGVGDLYGTTTDGGVSGCEVVFELIPSTGSWTETIVHSFTGGDACVPYAVLIFDSAGDLYGTTADGGANRTGTVFELTPANGGWTGTVPSQFLKR